MVLFTIFFFFYSFLFTQYIIRQCQLRRKRNINNSNIPLINLFFFFFFIQYDALRYHHNTYLFSLLVLVLEINFVNFTFQRWQCLMYLFAKNDLYYIMKLTCAFSVIYWTPIILYNVAQISIFFMIMKVRWKSLSENCLKPQTMATVF